MKEELRFAVRHPWKVLAVVVGTFVLGTVTLAWDWRAFAVLAVVEWMALTGIFTHYYNNQEVEDSE